MVTPRTTACSRSATASPEQTGRWWQHPAALAVAAAVVLGMVVGARRRVPRRGRRRRTGNVVAGTSDSPTGRGQRVDRAERDADTEQSRPRRSRSRATSTSTTSWTTASPRGCSASSDPTRGWTRSTAAVSTFLSEPAVDPDYSSPLAGGHPAARLREAGRHRARSTCRRSRQARRRGRDGCRAAGRLHRDGERQVGEEGRAARQRQGAGVRAQRLVAAGRRGPRCSTSRDYLGAGTDRGRDGVVAGDDQRLRHGLRGDGHLAGLPRRREGRRGLHPGRRQRASSASSPTPSTWTPGTYEVRAFESSAEDGSPQHVDTKTFTVE